MWAGTKARVSSQRRRRRRRRRGEGGRERDLWNILRWGLTNHRPSRDSVRRSQCLASFKTTSLAHTGPLSSQVWWRARCSSPLFVFSFIPFRLAVSQTYNTHLEGIQPNYHCERPAGWRAQNKITLPGPKANKHLSIMWKCVLDLVPCNSTWKQRLPSAWPPKIVLSLSLQPPSACLHIKSCCTESFEGRIPPVWICLDRWAFLGWRAAVSWMQRCIERWGLCVQRRETDKAWHFPLFQSLSPFFIFCSSLLPPTLN